MGKFSQCPRASTCERTYECTHKSLHQENCDCFGRSYYCPRCAQVDEEITVAELVRRELPAQSVAGVPKPTKPRMDLLPFDALEATAQVLGSPATLAKHKANSWMVDESQRPVSVHAGSLLRHIAAFMRGEDADPDSGELHLAHAACRVLFLLAHQLRGTSVDDRAVPNKKGETK